MSLYPLITRLTLAAFILVCSPTAVFPQDTPPQDPVTGTPPGPLKEGWLPAISSLQSEWNVDGAIQFEKAIALSELCILAYNDSHSRNLTSRLLGFEEVVLLDEGPMSGFMARSGDMAVVVFRGTNISSPRDWMTNLNFFSQSRLQGELRFHEGFHDAYARFSDQIRMTLKEWKPRLLWLTGHSLGGAMAVCCAYDCLTYKIPVSGLVTFGQPRVANPSMAKFLNDRLAGRYLRFLNNKDIVPSVPTHGPPLLSDYQHAGQTAWLHGKEIERNVLLMQAKDVSSGSGVGSEQDAEANDESTEEPDELEKLFAEPPQESKSLKAVENLITAEELNDLQFFLQSSQPLIGSEPISLEPQQGGGRARLYSRRTFQTDLPVQSALETPTTKLQGFANRFTDHSMLEYLRVLREHQDRSESAN